MQAVALKIKPDMAPKICQLYCRTCGQVYDAVKGLPEGQPIHMAWWEYEHLIRGVGCGDCEGVVPKYISDMSEADRDHVQYGLQYQWEEAIRKAVKAGHKPYESFPLPDVPPFFIWSEPGLQYRVDVLDPEIATLVTALRGSADALRIHPEAVDNEADSIKFGLWHEISGDFASTEAENTSVKYHNVYILQAIFPAVCEIMFGKLWVLVGHDRNGLLSFDRDTLILLLHVQEALAKYGAVTPEIMKKLQETAKEKK